MVLEKYRGLDIITYVYIAWLLLVYQEESNARRDIPQALEKQSVPLELAQVGIRP